MKRLIRWVVILGVLGGLGWAVSGPMAAYMKERRRIHYRDAEVSRGRIVAVVNSTGTIKPVQSVSIGSFVSGPIEAIFADFNQDVVKGQLLAKVDPKTYAAHVARDNASVASAKATLATRVADVEQVRAKLQQTKNEEERAMSLQKENKNFVSIAEMDKLKFEHLALAAQLKVAIKTVDQADAAVEQAKAQLRLSQANLDYTEIRSPVDGMVIDRKIDPGQTMAAQFQTPELFVVAPDMRKEMHVFASVDESDIGFINDAQKAGQPVTFVVDAYRDKLFKGKIYQIRKSSTVLQNVVTYPVVVSVPNDDLKLLPGMTASLSFQLEEKDDLVRIPNAALRFYPLRDQVHPDDRYILDNKPPVAGETEDGFVATPSAVEKAKMRRDRNRRHVWIVEGDFLRAIEVITGLSDKTSTEMVSGKLEVGQKLVTGVQTKK